MSSQSAKEASAAAVSLNGFLPPPWYRIPKCRVVYIYLTKRFNAWQCVPFGCFRYLVNRLAENAMSGLVRLATYSTPPSMLAYDHVSVGGGSPSFVANNFSPPTVGVLHFLLSTSPAACAILVIASSWLSSTQPVPSGDTPRFTFIFNIHLHSSLNVTLLKRCDKASFHHCRSVSLLVILMRSSTYVRTIMRCPFTHLM